MTTTYNIANNVGKVRLITGDKDITNAAFTDEEINVFLTEQSGNVNLASADVLEAWAATYGQSPDNEKIGDYSYTQKIISNMLALSKRLRDTDASTPVFEISEMDLQDDADTVEMGE